MKAPRNPLEAALCASVCQTKVPYDSKREARDGTHSAKRRGIGMDPYECPFCGKWHLRTRSFKKGHRDKKR